MSNIMRTPFENPIANISLSAHMAVISFYAPLAPADLVKNLESDSKIPP